MICFGCKRQLPMEKLNKGVQRYGVKRWLCVWCEPLEAAKNAAAFKRHMAAKLERVLKDQGP